MRFILTLILILLLYQALKVVIRSAVAAYRHDHDEPRRKRIASSDMVLDPNCRTYVVKERAIARRAGGATEYFCSEACAEEYRNKLRS